MEEKSEEILLTIIVPCFNVEKYVQRCIDSIYACDLAEERFEVLCVNDCSPDNVQEVLEHNEKQHGNLRVVVHKQNKGLGGARNTGISEARGKYLWFVDADDTVSGKHLESIVLKTTVSDLDVLCFNYRRVDDSGDELSAHLVFQTTEPMDGCSFVKQTFGDAIVNHMGYVWRFVYKTDFLRSHQLYFPENVCWEDTVFMPKAILEAGRVAALPDVLYSYRVNAESISGVFDRAYPAKLIFEYAFCAGRDLLQFSDEVSDERLKAAFRAAAIDKYINGYPIHLFRTSKKERKHFFEMVNERKMELEPLKQHMRLLGKVLMVPCLGPSLAGLISLGYKITRKKKHV